MLIGAFTWGRGTLHYDCDVFYKKLNRVDYSEKVICCFGSGDRSFTQFCGAVDLFHDKVKERGATIVSQNLKIHLEPDTEEDIARCNLFSQEFKQLLVRTKAVTVSI
ncbi:flavodoxin domain-containing protein [Cytobacillus luteolus]|uniref:flavodoxin domain-containing protein n=1 Tax=Litchfieldia luteola TaxID=682179 RepID=UPI00398B653D